jgi:cytochrome b
MPPAAPPQPEKVAVVPVRVWDLPTRLFHWSLLIAVTVAWISGSNGFWQVHFLAGLSVLALVLFRLLWGVLGSESSRFATFLRGPRHALAHFWEVLRGRPDHDTTHNALGGWATVVILALLAAQAGMGLIADADDGLTYGPLMDYAPSWLVQLATGLHKQNAWLILAVAALHVLAIMAYWLLAGRDLITPMVTGIKHLPALTRAPRMASLWLALGLFVLCAAAVRGVAALG